jgi:cytochrome c oxidase subunit 2
MAARRLPVRKRGPVALAVVAGAALMAGGCGQQSALDPQSKPSREIATLWWWMLGAAGVVLGGALFLLLLAWVRRRTPGLPVLGRHEKLTTALVVVFGIVIPLATNVTIFVVANFVVAKATTPPAHPTGMTIQVVGHQFFWEVRYPGGRAVTANEIHIPVGTTVNVVATTDDVIHSFWVPQLNRKIDMIPGHPNRLALRADRPGRFRGQCAEYCGEQHAHMAMYVYADPPARFRTWLAGIAAPRRAPQTAPETRGERVFLANACADCHSIRGTSARGTVGPDLTHVGARATLAALMLPNRPGTLSHWLRNPQEVKPGNRMPDLTLPDRDWRDLVAYLEQLR